jgi:hypothetical protein
MCLLGMLESGGMVSLCMMFCCCVVGLCSVFMVLRCLLVLVVCHFDYLTEAMFLLRESICPLHAKIDQCRVNISRDSCSNSSRASRITQFER